MISMKMFVFVHARVVADSQRDAEIFRERVVALVSTYGRIMKAVLLPYWETPGQYEIDIALDPEDAPTRVFKKVIASLGSRWKLVEAAYAGDEEWLGELLPGQGGQPTMDGTVYAKVEIVARAAMPPGYFLP